MIIFVAAKVASALNPLVYAISHPKYREALAREIPCLGIGKFIQNPTFGTKKLFSCRWNQLHGDPPTANTAKMITSLSAFFRLPLCSWQVEVLLVLASTGVGKGGGGGGGGLEPALTTTIK